MAQIDVSRCILLVSTHRHSRPVAPHSLRLSRSQELAKRAQNANAESQAAAKILDAVAGCGGQLHDALRIGRDCFKRGGLHLGKCLQFRGMWLMQGVTQQNERRHQVKGSDCQCCPEIAERSFDGQEQRISRQPGGNDERRDSQSGGDAAPNELSKQDLAAQKCDAAIEFPD